MSEYQDQQQDGQPPPDPAEIAADEAQAQQESEPQAEPTQIHDVPPGSLTPGVTWYPPEAPPPDLEPPPEASPQDSEDIPPDEVDAEPMGPEELPDVADPSFDDIPRPRYDAMAAMNQRMENVEGRNPNPEGFPNPFFAKITGGNDTDGWNWQEEVRIDGDWADFTDSPRAATNSDADYNPLIVVPDGATVQEGKTYLFVEILDPKAGSWQYVVVVGGGDSVSFYITSATGTTGLYNAKSITPGTATSSSFGTQADEEDLLVWNGAETSGIASTNNLLVSPNTTAFDVMGSGTVVGIDSDSGNRIVNTWMGFVACSSSDGGVDGGSP